MLLRLLPGTLASTLQDMQLPALEEEPGSLRQLQGDDLSDSLPHVVEKASDASDAVKDIASAKVSIKAHQPDHLGTLVAADLQQSCFASIAVPQHSMQLLTSTCRTVHKTSSFACCRSPASLALDKLLKSCCCPCCPTAFAIYLAV
jgi:hypothetical protein